MKKYIFIAFASLSIIACITIYYGYTTFFKPNSTGKISYLYIPRDATYAQVTDSLISAKALKSYSSFKRAASHMDLQIKFKPGRYKIEKNTSNRMLIRSISNGWQSPVNLVLAGNIRTKDKLASVLSRFIDSDSTSILKVLESDSLAKKYKLNSQTITALFLPNTYQVYWTTSPEELINRFKKEYDKFWNDERLSKANKIGLTQVEVTTLASIVCEESNLIKEQPTIAGVYINRLKKGMLLQADPTVKYVLNDPSIKRILHKHLVVDSPYNTYKYKGLPPGPISIPPLHTIDAVLDYDVHKFLYFCAKPTLDGSHYFASNLNDHTNNARAYQKVISKLKK